MYSIHPSLQSLSPPPKFGGQQLHLLCLFHHVLCNQAFRRGPPFLTLEKLHQHRVLCQGNCHGEASELEPAAKAWPLTSASPRLPLPEATRCRPGRRQQLPDLWKSPQGGSSCHNPHAGRVSSHIGGTLFAKVVGSTPLGIPAVFSGTYSALALIFSSAQWPLMPE